MVNTINQQKFILSFNPIQAPYKFCITAENIFCMRWQDLFSCSESSYITQSFRLSVCPSVRLYVSFAFNPLLPHVIWPILGGGVCGHTCMELTLYITRFLHEKVIYFFNSFISLSNVYVHVHACVVGAIYTFLSLFSHYLFTSFSNALLSILNMYMHACRRLTLLLFF